MMTVLCFCRSTVICSYFCIYNDSETDWVEKHVTVLWCFTPQLFADGLFISLNIFSAYFTENAFREKEWVIGVVIYLFLCCMDLLVWPSWGQAGLHVAPGLKWVWLPGLDHYVNLRMIHVAYFFLWSIMLGERHSVLPEREHVSANCVHYTQYSCGSFL